MSDATGLDRYLDAQDAYGTYAAAITELRAGRKTSHWMWFVFPQLAGLGRSVTARKYAIASPDEARAYLAHPVLGHRLRDCAAAVAASQVADADDLLGVIDALKLRSSMTLFATVTDGDPAFDAVLERFYAGVPDPETVRLLAQA